MARRDIPATTFLSHTTKTNDWTANQSYTDCIRLIFGTGSDVALFWKNAGCSDTFRSHVGTVVCCEGGDGSWIHEGHFTAKSRDATNNAIEATVQIGHTTTGCPANGIGSSIRWFVETTGAAAGQQIGQFGYLWTNVTHACRTADFFINVCQDQTQTRWLTFDTSAKEVQFGALHYLTIPAFTDCNRGCPGTAGRLIFNSTSNTLNYDNGTNWLCINNGCTT